MARQLRDEGELELDEKRMQMLEEACVHHDQGEITSDPTIATCWDSDRLNLVRLGMRINPARLSTAAARKLATAEGTRLFSMALFDWQAIVLDYRATLGELPGSPAYLRFGTLPEEGCSRAPLGRSEGGVSVYPGIYLKGSGTYQLDFRRLLLGLDSRFLVRLLRQARPLYAVEGRRVGVGCMGEPVLADARIIKEVPAYKVGVLPGRRRFRALIKGWRGLREGKDARYFDTMKRARRAQYGALDGTRPRKV